MSKAQEKRDKQLRESLTIKLNAKLRKFKNDYLGDYTNYKRTKLERELNYNIKLSTDADSLKLHNDNLLMSTRMPMRKWFRPVTHESFLPKIKQIEYELSFGHLNDLEWLKEANENYIIKFNKLIEKLVSCRMDLYHIKIEAINGGTARDFGFLISDTKIEVHARVIYAQGEVNAPHYRFITTERSK